MKKILLIVALVMVPLFAFQALAQDRTVTGVVTSADDGSTLPGVNIMIKGTTTGAITGADGSYSISVPSSGGILVFSFIGFTTQEFEIGSRSAINVSLTEDITQISEIIVVGYGTTQKEALTGSVGIVDAETFQQIPMASFEDAMKGSVAGMQVTALDGQPGGNSTIRIRGYGSISAGSTPLYVIDGIPVETGSVSETGFDNGNRSSNIMATINPNDIETVTVLKDASATAIYGSRGANGVILITTKQGKAGKSSMNFSAQVGIGSNASKGILTTLNEEEYHTLFLEGYVNRGDTPAEAQTRYDNWYPDPADTDWREAISRNGMTQQYDLNASGSFGGLNYYTSIGYFDQEANFIGSDFNRISSRVNINGKVSDRVTVSNNLMFSTTESNGMVDGTAWANPMYNSLLLSPAIPIYDDEGLFYAGHKGFFMGGNNPVGKLSGDDERTQQQMRVIDNLSIAVEIIDNLTFKTAWSFDLLSIYEWEYRNMRYGDGRNSNGYAKESATRRLSWIGTQTLDYRRTFAEKHSFNALLGYEANKSDHRSNYASGTEFPNPYVRTLASAAQPSTAWSSGTMYSFVSMFSRFTYDYERKYIATFSFRRDGSSRFGADKRYGNFWSVGAAWRVTEESFMENMGWLDDFKLRFSYGITGNADIGNFASKGLTGFGQDYEGIPGSGPSQIGNPMLTWETQATMDIGFDFSIFNRVDGTVTYFTRDNTDLILNRPLSLTTGFYSNTQNFGAMQNKGWEVELNGDVVRTNDFTWNLGINFSMFKNEITKLEEPIVGDYTRREEGRDYYEFWMWHWAGVDPATGEPSWYTDETMETITNDIGDASKFYTGKTATPSSFGSVNTRLSYKGLSLDAQFSWVWDKYMYDASAFVYHGDGRYTPRSISKWAYDNRWINPGDETTFPQFIWGNGSNSNSRYQTRYLLDATYMRLRNLTLAYMLPANITNKVKVSTVRVYFRGQNLWTWTRDKDLYVDPEQSISGYVNSVQPLIKTFTLGLDIGF